jgi:hypothetical protein
MVAKELGFLEVSAHLLRVLTFKFSSEGHKPIDVIFYF